MSEGLWGGNNHNVQVGEHWRLQTLRNPYMCPLLEEDGEKFNPVKQMFLTISHLVDGKLSDTCCYFDAEIIMVNSGYIHCKVVEGSPPDWSGNSGYSVIEVLNDDTMVRFFNKEGT
jgi:hypothetical protein